jgi:hypothetical protein
MSDLKRAIQHFENDSGLRQEFQFTLAAMKEADRHIERLEAMLEFVWESSSVCLNLRDYTIPHKTMNAVRATLNGERTVYRSRTYYGGDDVEVREALNGEQE